MYGFFDNLRSLARLGAVARLLATASLVATSPAWAEEERRDEALQALVGIAKLTSKDVTATSCHVAAEIDFSGYLDKLPVFREAWLNRDYSIDFYRQRRKQVLTFVVLKRYAELLTEGMYGTSARDAPVQCSFSADVVYPNKFGKEQTLTALTWKFSRKRAGEIDWEKFDPRDFHQLALEYKVNQDVMSWMSDEPSMQPEAKPQAAAKCDMFLFKANAVFIRATTFCSKNYMDSAAGHSALAGARACMPMDDMKSRAMEAMSELDHLVKQRGRARACQWVEVIAQQVGAPRR